MNTRPSNARSSADPLVAARHVVGWLLDLSHISWRITREPPRRCQEPYASEQAEWGDEPPAAVTGGGAVARAAVPVLRTATVKDLDSIGAVMRASVLALFPPYYDERQTASAAVHIAHVDPVLVADGTYFVFVADGEIVACGGWSRRGRLYVGDGDHQDDDRLLDPATEAAHIRAMFVRGDWTRRGLGRAILEAGRDAARAEGFQRMDLGATLPGVPLYRAFGFEEIERFVVTMPDGVQIEAVRMERQID